MSATTILSSNTNPSTSKKTAAMMGLNSVVRIETIASVTTVIKITVSVFI